MASNDIYVAKQAEYKNSGNYLTRSLVDLKEVGQDTSITRINNKLASFSTWNSTSINQRHMLLMALAGDIWKTTLIDA